MQRSLGIVNEWSEGPGFPQHLPEINPDGIAGIVYEPDGGYADPVQAMEDALRTFCADEIILSTHPPGRSHWLEKGVVDKARERFTVPITHVVVDLEREREEIRA